MERRDTRVAGEQQPPAVDGDENTWQVPGRPLSAYAEGTAVVLAGLDLVVHRGVLPNGFRSLA